jgi:drug/metabolite transporter (DMT)-like permease
VVSERAVSLGKERVGVGIACAAVGIAFMALFDALAKLLGENYHVVQLVFFRNFFGLLFVLVLVARSGLGSLGSRHPVLHGLRAAFALGATFSFFIGLQFMPLAEAFAITFTGPIFITVLSIPVLGETVGLRRWSAVLVGFVGVVIMLRPGSEALRVEALLPLTAALCYAFVMLLSRKLSRREPVGTVMFWTALIGTLASGASLPFEWLAPTPGDWALFILLGLLGSVTMWFMTMAYRHAPAAVIAPFDYTILLWGLLLGWLIWRELPDPAIWRKPPRTRPPPASDGRYYDGRAPDARSKRRGTLGRPCRLCRQQVNPE